MWHTAAYSFADPDTHGSVLFGKPDPDPHRGQKQDPHQSQNIEAVNAKNGAMYGRRGPQWRLGG